MKKGSGSKEAAPQIAPENFTLLLKTRLRHGRISYDEQDVEQRLLYRENKTGNLRVKVTEDKDTKLSRLVSGALQTASNYRPSWPQ